MFEDTPHADGFFIVDIKVIRGIKLKDDPRLPVLSLMMYGVI